MLKQVLIWFRWSPLALSVAASLVALPGDLHAGGDPSWRRVVKSSNWLETPCPARKLPPDPFVIGLTVPEEEVARLLCEFRARHDGQPQNIKSNYGFEVSVPSGASVFLGGGKLKTGANGVGDLRFDLPASATDLISGSEVFFLNGGFEPKGRKDVDGYAYRCQLEAGAETCGNSLLERAELCDDGNRRSGDGCDAFCAIEVE